MAFDEQPIMREITLELEYMIEEVIGYNRIKDKNCLLYTSPSPRDRG